MLALASRRSPTTGRSTLNLAAISSASLSTRSGDGPVDPVRTLGRWWISIAIPTRAGSALLAHIQGRGESDGDLDRALATLEPLIRSCPRRPSGHLARGDAMIAHAETRRTEALLALRLARDALDEYDVAARDSGLADAYAGRALALDILGELEAAIEAQRVPVSSIRGPPHGGCASPSWRAVRR